VTPSIGCEREFLSGVVFFIQHTRPGCFFLGACSQIWGCILTHKGGARGRGCGDREIFLEIVSFSGGIIGAFFLFRGGGKKFFFLFGGGPPLFPKRCSFRGGVLSKTQKYGGGNGQKGGFWLCPPPPFLKGPGFVVGVLLSRGFFGGTRVFPTLFGGPFLGPRRFPFFIIRPPRPPFGENLLGPPVPPPHALERPG